MRRATVGSMPLWPIPGRPTGPRRSTGPRPHPRETAPHMADLYAVAQRHMTARGISLRPLAAGGEIIRAASRSRPDAAPVEAPVAPEVVDYFRMQLAGHYTADMYLGPLHLIPTMQTQTELITRLPAAADTPVRRGLLDTGAAYAALLGWLYQDAGNLTESAKWRDTHALPRPPQRRSPACQLRADQQVDARARPGRRPGRRGLRGGRCRPGTGAVTQDAPDGPSAPGAGSRHARRPRDR
jgi:hypothetical protein